MGGREGNKYIWRFLRGVNFGHYTEISEATSAYFWTFWEKSLNYDYAIHGSPSPSPLRHLLGCIILCKYYFHTIITEKAIYHKKIGRQNGHFLAFLKPLLWDSLTNWILWWSGKKIATFFFFSGTCLDVITHSSL